MTNSKHPVVWAIEETIRHFQATPYEARLNRDACVFELKKALPLARELTEKAEALEYLVKFWGNHLITIMAKDEDFPVKLKKMIGERYE